MIKNPKRNIPHPTDVAVGGRIRMRRLMLDMSQQDLGNALGVPLQQVQKYEEGTNCIGACGLQAAGNAMGVSVSFFFGEQHEPSASTLHDPVTAFLSTSEGLALSQAFREVKSENVRRRIVDLVKAVADAESMQWQGNRIFRLIIT